MARQDEDLWMKKIKEMLEDHSEEIPPHGWNRLENELTPSARIFSFKWRGVAAAILLAALLTTSLLFLHTHTADEIRETSVAMQTTDGDIIPDVPSVEVLTPKTELPPIRVAVAQVQHVPSSIQMPTGVAVSNEPTDTDIPTPTEKQIVVEKKEQKEETINRPSSSDKLHLPVVKVQKKKQSDWAVAAHISSLASSATSAKGTNLLNTFETSFPELSYALSNGVVDIPVGQELIYKDGVPYLSNSNQIVDAKHHQPISLGVTVRKTLTRHISVETGITYTLLSSDLKLLNKEEVEQKLHYIGIPLKANWNFVDSKLLTLYLSAGGAVERCVYGKQGGNKKTVDAWQFSLLGTVGAQYNVSRRMGLFVEPGVAYHFDDGSDVETIRKEKPLYLNLQAGIRFTY